MAARMLLVAAIVGWLVSVAAACSSPGSPPQAAATAPTVSPASSAPAPTERSVAAPGYRSTPLTPAVPVRVGIINSSSDAGMFIALEKGYFREEGLDVELIPFAASADGVTAVLAGQWEILTGALAAGIYNAAARGVPLRIVADKGSTPSPEWDFTALMIRKDLIDTGRVKDYADLKGLILARASLRGTSPEISTVKALAKGGLTLDDVESTALSFPDMIPGFANGAIDGAIVLEPIISRIEQMGTAVRWRGNSEFYGNQQIAAIMYGPSILSQPPEIGRRWMIAYIRGMRDYNDAFGPKRQGREAVVQALMKYTPIKDPTVYEEMRPAGLDPDGKLVLPSIRDDLAYYEQSGLVREPVDLSQLVDTSYQEYAVQQLGPYQR
jgi:NitT/TauT family transport system substrate-binding protein